MQSLSLIRSKIFSREGIKAQVEAWKAQGLRVVFSNGCFDILHVGHITYLSGAAMLGDKLVIGMNTDTSVRRLKGPERPVNDENARTLLMAAMLFVDAVVLFDEDTPYNLIKEVMPAILVKGKDYEEKDVVGGDIVKAAGGKVVTLDLVEGFSSSNIIEKMKKGQ